MAPSQKMLAVFAIVAVAILPLAMARLIIVGDEHGWIPGFNYASWVEGKEFRVGDDLGFVYNPGFHNVIEVGGAEFKACMANDSDKVLATGYDVVPLDTPGKKWFMCGKGDHCLRGQKFVINVLPDIGPASPPTSPSPGPSTTPPSPPTSPSPGPSTTPPSPPSSPFPSSIRPASPPAPSSSSKIAAQTYQILMAAMAAAAVMLAIMA